MLQPIAVSRIDNGRLLPSRQRGEFSIASVETVFDKRLREIGILAVVSFGQLNAFNQTRRTLEDFLIEAVTNSGLAAWIQMLAILGLNFASEVDE